MKIVRFIVLLLMIAGSLNWGLVGIFDYNLVEMIFVKNSILTKIAYVLIGLAGIYGISFIFSKGMCGIHSCKDHK